MTGTTAWVDHFQLIRCQCGVFLANLSKLRLHFWLLLGFFQIVVPFGIFWVAISFRISRLFFLRWQKLLLHVRVSLQPQTAKTVLYHVANNPIRCEKLGCCWNIFFCDFHILFQCCENIVLFLAVIVLIKPSYDLNLICPVFFRNQCDHLLNHTSLAEKIIRQKQFRIILNLLKHARQNTGQSITLSNQKILIQFFRLVGILQLKNLVHIQAFQIQLYRIRQNLRLELAILIGENSGMTRQIIIHFHESERSKTVEPGISHFFHHLFKSFLVDFCNQCLPLLLFCRSKHPAADAIRIRRSSLLLRNFILLCLLCDTRNQLLTRPRRIFLYRIFIHKLTLPLLNST